MRPWASAEILILFLFLRSSFAFVATKLSGAPFHAPKDRNDVPHHFIIETGRIRRTSSVHCGMVAGTDVSLGVRPHSQQQGVHRH